MWIILFSHLQFLISCGLASPKSAIVKSMYTKLQQIYLELKNPML